VDRLTVLQQAIDRTSETAGRYQADRDCLEIHGTDLLTSGGAWSTGGLPRLLLDIADDHHGCLLPECRTCAAIRQGLMFSLAALRSMQRFELERRVEVSPRRVWWNKLNRWPGNS
jgi:hypothetical protein